MIGTHHPLSLSVIQSFDRDAFDGDWHDLARSQSFDCIAAIALCPGEEFGHGSALSSYKVKHRDKRLLEMWERSENKEKRMIEKRQQSREFCASLEQHSLRDTRELCVRFTKPFGLAEALRSAGWRGRLVSSSLPSDWDQASTSYMSFT